jgi:hypothetical protein
VVARSAQARVIHSRTKDRLAKRAAILFRGRRWLGAATTRGQRPRGFDRILGMGWRRFLELSQQMGAVSAIVAKAHEIDIYTARVTADGFEIDEGCEV